MMAAPLKGSSEETARLLTPEVVSAPPPRRFEGDPLNPRAFKDGTPPALSLTTVLRVLTACFALASFVIIMVILPHEWWYDRNKGYVPSAVFDMLAFVWQSSLLLKNLSKLRIVVELGDREFGLGGGRRRGYNDNLGLDQKPKHHVHHLISLVDLALFAGLLPSWIVMLTRRHDSGIVAVDALVLILEAVLVLSQSIPVLRRLVITLKEDDSAYEVNLPSEEA